MRIDFVSDVACPWCAIGLAALENALAKLPPEIPVELHLQPFELNPTLGPEGADTVQYLSSKYGIGPEQIARNQGVIRERRKKYSAFRPAGIPRRGGQVPVEVAEEA